MGQTYGGEIQLAPHSDDFVLRWGALRMLKTIPDYSRMVLFVTNMLMHAPKARNSLILQPLWCDLHVFQGPTWDLSLIHI